MEWHETYDGIAYSHSIAIQVEEDLFLPSHCVCLMGFETPTSLRVTSSSNICSKCGFESERMKSSKFFLNAKEKEGNS